jgi:hypothetical protein
MIRMIKLKHKSCDHPRHCHVLHIPLLIALIGLLTGCGKFPNFHQVMATSDEGFIITRVHTERIPFEEQTHKEIHLIKLDPAGEPLWDMRTLNREGSDRKMISDGNGGVIIAFTDTRGEAHDTRDRGFFYSPDLYIQRFDATGRSLWGAEDVPLRVDAEQLLDLAMVADGAGGAVVVWGESTEAIYAQRVDASGQKLWSTEGIPVTETGKWVYKPSLAKDGAGGAFIVWLEQGSKSDYLLHGQHLNAQGQPLWQENGIPLVPVSCSGKVVVGSDGRDGLVVVWNKPTPEGGMSQRDLYAQRFDVDGQTCWEQAVSLPEDIHQPTPGGVMQDGQGNLLISWGGKGVHIQKLDLEGHKLWSDAAIFIGGGLDHAITDVHAIPDNAGGAFIVWRVGKMMKEGKIYVQHLDADGHAQWSGSGVLAYPQVTNYQGSPQIVSDHNGGVVVFSLLGKTLNRAEIYGQKIDAEGHLLWSEEGLRVRFE